MMPWHDVKSASGEPLAGRLGAPASRRPRAVAIVAAATLASTILAYRAPAAAQDGPMLEEITPAPELGRGTRPIDIARMTWRVAGSDSAAMSRREFDDSSWVARAGVSQELLRNPAAWYRFTFVLAEGTKGLGSRLELGGVEGNVAVYLNGTLLGEMRGATEPLYSRIEAFTLPAALLDPDRNVLALRLTGHAGRAKVGIPQGPIRLFPLSTAYEREDRAIRALKDVDQTAALLGGLTAKLEDFGLQARRAKVLMATGGAQSGVESALAAMEAVRKAALATASATPPAFGRFGGGHVEGLLTAALWPAGFQSATTSMDPAPVIGWFGEPSAADHAALEGISPESKTVRVLQALGGRYRLHYSLLYPGFALEPLDSTLSVRFNSPMDALWVDRWGVATASAAVQAKIPWAEPWLLLHDRAGRRPPILIALSTPRAALRLAPAAGGFRVELPARAIARFCWPTGLMPWGPAVAGGDMARFRAWADAMVPFTRTAVETPKGDRLAVRETFRYLPAGSVPYAPLPPAYGLVLAAGATGDVQAPRTDDLGVPTLAGPLWAVRRSAELQFSLPLPAPDSLAVPRTEGAPSVGAGDLPDTLSHNAMDLAFTKRVDALLRWPSLSKAGRAALEANGQAQLTRAWGPLAWADSSEPLTGRSYRWSLAQWVPDGRVQAFSKPNALAIYGTSVAALFTGDWSIATTQWTRVTRAFDWFESAFDWAWQVPVDTETGVWSGDLEARAAAYLGALGMSRLAAIAVPGDDRGAGAPYLALAARVRPLLVRPHLVDAYAQAHGLLPPGAFAKGLHENGIQPATESLAARPLADLPELAAPAAATESLPALLDWSPARLDDLVWKPKTATLEAKLSLKQPTDRFQLRIRSRKPMEVLLNGQAIDFSYDASRSIVSYEPGQSTGAQTLTVKF